MRSPAKPACGAGDWWETVPPYGQKKRSTYVMNVLAAGPENPFSQLYRTCMGRNTYLRFNYIGGSCQGLRPHVNIPWLTPHATLTACYY